MRLSSTTSRHPANVAHFDEATFGQRAADWVVTHFGSWSFVLWQTAIVAVWIAVNVVAVTLRWDPYPFILFNLAFSTQAAYAAPVILLAQNRQTQHDTLRAEADHQMISELRAMLIELNQHRSGNGG